MLIIHLITLVLAISEAEIILKREIDTLILGLKKLGHGVSESSVSSKWDLSTLKSYKAFFIKEALNEKSEIINGRDGVRRWENLVSENPTLASLDKMISRDLNTLVGVNAPGGSTKEIVAKVTPESKEFTTLKRKVPDSLESRSRMPAKKQFLYRYSPKLPRLA